MKKLPYLIFISLLFLPIVVHAQDVVTLVNPLGDGVTDPRLIIARVIQAALSIVGSVALLMFVYGGFLWLTSAGNATAVEKGKNVLLWAVMGLVLIASSYVLVTAIFQGLATGSVTG